MRCLSSAAAKLADNHRHAATGLEYRPRQRPPLDGLPKPRKPVNDRSGKT
jgi:hypothetical protein